MSWESICTEAMPALSNTKPKTLLVVAAVSGFVAVALGAFGAHLLKGQIEPALYNAFQTGVNYHGLHSIALLVVGLLVRQHPSTWLVRSGWLMCTGMLLFSGSLYLMAVSGYRPLGIITPFGGMTLLLGWLGLALGLSQLPD